MTSFAMIFPGQGSQSVGMLADLQDRYPVVQETFEYADAILGQELSIVVAHGPSELLDSTEYTQPAMLTADVAVWRAWQAAATPAPDVVAGHSLGELAALVAADVVGFEDALRLSRVRARAMQDAVSEVAGAMAAIVGLDNAAVEAVCEQCADGAVLEPVNYNAPGQVVIAGEASAVERAIVQAKADGARMAVKLPVSVPSHCALMHPAAETFAEALSDVTFSPASRPVVQNVTGRAETEPDALRANLIAQLHSPVRWVTAVQTMQASGVSHLLECGPGKVLTGLTRRIDRSLTGLTLGRVGAIDEAKTALEDAA